MKPRDLPSVPWSKVSERNVALHGRCWVCFDLFRRHHSRECYPPEGSAEVRAIWGLGPVVLLRTHLIPPRGP